MARTDVRGYAIISIALANTRRDPENIDLYGVFGSHSGKPLRNLANRRLQPLGHLSVLPADVALVTLLGALVSRTDLHVSFPMQPGNAEELPRCSGPGKAKADLGIVWWGEAADEPAREDARFTQRVKLHQHPNADYYCRCE